MTARMTIFAPLVLLLLGVHCAAFGAEEVGYIIEVSSSIGEIKDSGKTMVEVPKGTRLWVFREQGTKWLLVKDPDADRQGWIHRDQIRRVNYPTSRIQKQVEQSYHDGKRYMTQTNYSSAVKSFRTFLENTKRRFGNLHSATIGAKDKLASALQKRDQAGDAYLADALFSESVKAAKVLWGQFHSRTSIILSNHGILKREIGEGKKAEELYREAMLIDEKLNQPSVILLHNLGRLLTLRGDTHEAIKVFEKAEDVVHNNRTTNSSTARDIRVRLQEARAALAAQQAVQIDLPADLVEVVDFDSSRPHLAINRHNAPSFQEMICGASLSNTSTSPLPDPKQYFQTLIDALPRPSRRGSKSDLIRRAVMVQTQAETTVPEENYQRHRKAIALLRLGEEDNSHLAYVMSTMADFAITAGHYEEAGKTLQVACQLLEDKITDDMSATGAILSIQGKLSGTLGDPAHAVACYRRAIALNYIAAQQWDIIANPFDRANRLNTWIQSRDRDSLPVVVRTILLKHNERQREVPNPLWSWVTTDLPDLAAKQSLLGQFDQAIKTLRVIEKIGIRQFGANHLELAGTYLGQGIVYSRLNENELAKVSLNKSLTILKRHFGVNAQVVANCEIALANAHRHLKEFEQAVEHQQAAISVLRRVLRNGHPETALAKARLGAIKVDMGLFEVAEQLLTESMPVVTQKLGDLHPDLIEFHVLLGEVHAAMGHTNEAVVDFREVVERLRIYSTHTLASQSEQQQLSFLAYTFQNCERRTMQALYPLIDEPGVKRALVETILNTRGFSLECLTRRYQLAQQSDDPKVILIRDQLDKARAELAAAFSRHANKAATESLVKRVEDLSSSLGRLTGQRIETKRWISLDDIHLEPNSALVLFHRADWNIGRSTPDARQHEHYVAFVLNEDGTINVTELGNRMKVEEVVAECRRKLSLSWISKLGAADAEQALQKPLRQLSMLVIHPLTSELGDTKRWIVSPDGPLWSIPFQCLLLEDDSYVVEQHELSYFNSQSELAAKERPKPGRMALILANPDYDAELSGVSIESSGEVRPPPPEAYAVELRDGIPHDWEQLPGTQLELDAVRPHISRWLDLTSEQLERHIVTDIHASEAAIRECAKPRVLSLSTHGYFLQTPRSGGLGVQLISGFRGLRVVDIIPEGAAEQDGRLQKGDVIVSVFDASLNDSISLANKLVIEAAPYLKGEPDTKLRFDVVKAESGETVTYLVPRKQLPQGKSEITSSDALTSPLLRCGLVFAGANRSNGIGRQLNDGFLSGVEICSLDLAGTELVMLSACETGLGDSFSMEGVVGLRHAFQSAGAQTVVSTLWQIPDEQTAQLLETFWKQLADGSTKSAALCEAQRAMIRKSAESDTHSSHPFFWAAFTITAEGAERSGADPTKPATPTLTGTPKLPQQDLANSSTIPSKELPAASERSEEAVLDNTLPEGVRFVTTSQECYLMYGPKIRLNRIPKGTKLEIEKIVDDRVHVIYTNEKSKSRGWVENSAILPRK